MMSSHIVSKSYYDIQPGDKLRYKGATIYNNHSYKVGKLYNVEVNLDKSNCVVYDDNGKKDKFSVASNYMIAQFVVVPQLKLRKDKLKTIL